jgi:hypothetical protein
MSTQKTPQRIIEINGSSFLIGASLTDTEVVMLLKVLGSLTALETSYLGSRYANRITHHCKESIEVSLTVSSRPILTYAEYEEQLAAKKEEVAA